MACGTHGPPFTGRAYSWASRSAGEGIPSRDSRNASEAQVILPVSSARMRRATSRMTSAATSSISTWSIFARLQGRGQPSRRRARAELAAPGETGKARVAAGAFAVSGSAACRFAGGRKVIAAGQAGSGLLARPAVTTRLPPHPNHPRRIASRRDHLPDGTVFRGTSSPRPNRLARTTCPVERICSISGR
jgi:hypothetical protein